LCAMFAKRCPLLLPRPARMQVRHLNLHEYQSKAVLDKFGVNTQKWRLATNASEAKKAIVELNVSEYVVKAQVHAGGRGKGHFDSGFKGGVHVTDKADKVPELTTSMLGNRLITAQTPPAGVLVNKVMIAESLEIKKEFYFAVLMDRSSNGPVLVASPQGGMDIEKVAHETPNLIFKEPVDIKQGVQPEQVNRLARKLGFPDELIPQAAAQMTCLYNLFIQSDATQVEINPLAITNRGVFAVDAKINIDDNASYRQQELFAARDTNEDDPREVHAAKFNLNYIAMNGSIGCMVNGAGLAMATMDIIKMYGAQPANFLDVGGGASEQQVTEAFKIISADPQVKAILVNIFGGIMKCDVIANGILKAIEVTKLRLPVIVRLAGTNVEQGQKILTGVPNIISASDLDEAARKAVQAIGLKPTSAAAATAATVTKKVPKSPASSAASNKPRATASKKSKADSKK